jgi:hypothetical protein
MLTFFVISEIYKIKLKIKIKYILQFETSHSSIAKRWFFTAGIRVQSRVTSSEVRGGRSRTGAGVT